MKFSLTNFMKKILIIEDDKFLRELIAQKLLKENYDISEAVDGEEGLKKSLAEHPDLILLDIRMPKMDGMTMLKLLRQDPWGKDAKVIILTNLDPLGTILQGVVKDNPTYYLIKASTKFEDVLEKIREILEKPEQNAEPQ